MDKTINQKAWFLVLPVFLVVAFSAVLPLMTVVNYSMQDTFGNNQFFWNGVGWFKELLDPSTDLGGRFLASLGRNLFFSAVILAIEVPLGIVVALLMPGSLRLVTRLLAGWDAFAALYLVLAYLMMLRCGVAHIKRSAILQDDGRFLILLLTAFGALASLLAIVFELGASKGSPAGLAVAIVTITLSWAMVHTAFALHYAHEFYRGKTPGGLQFPSGDAHTDVDYWDFVYFSFVIGMTAQVSDVGITDKIIRRTATVHGIISFVFNTALLALMVNIAASLI